MIALTKPFYVIYDGTLLIVRKYKKKLKKLKLYYLTNLY